MPSQKRQRQREGREARRQAEIEAKRKKKTVRRAISIGIIVAFILAALVLAGLGGDDTTEVDTGDNPTTTEPADGDQTEGGEDGEGDGADGDGSTTTTEVAAPAKIGSQECPAADGSSPKTTTFDGAFKQCIDPAKTYKATITTDVGEFEMTFLPDKAPNTVNNFVSLARYHAYDGVPFHRVIPDFVVQGGDVALQNGTGDAGYKFNDELPAPDDYEAGSVAMANSGPNTNGSQFFVITSDAGAKTLVQAVGGEAKYSLFAKVTAGLDVVKKIEADGDQSGTPKTVHSIKTVTITES